MILTILIENHTLESILHYSEDVSLDVKFLLHPKVLMSERI
jgi:hypothetical protein